VLIVLLALATALSTFLGGVVAFRNQHQIHALLGFTAGVLLGVVAFDVFPEMFTLLQAHHMPPVAPLVAFVVGFLAFHIVEKLTILHYTHEAAYAKHTHPLVGVLSALALMGHRFADGIGIGLGFQVSPEMGVLVAIAVIAHDFSDGRLQWGPKNWGDTVGQPPSTEISVPNMPSLKTKKLRKLPQDKVLLEL